MPLAGWDDLDMADVGLLVVAVRRLRDERRQQ